METQQKTNLVDFQSLSSSRNTNHVSTTEKDIDTKPNNDSEMSNSANATKQKQSSVVQFEKKTDQPTEKETQAQRETLKKNLKNYGLAFKSNLDILSDYVSEIAKIDSEIQLDFLHGLVEVTTPVEQEPNQPNQPTKPKEHTTFKRKSKINTHDKQGKIDTKQKERNGDTYFIKIGEYELTYSTGFLREMYKKIQYDTLKIADNSQNVDSNGEVNEMENILSSLGEDIPLVVQQVLRNMLSKDITEFVPNVEVDNFLDLVETVYERSIIQLFNLETIKFIPETGTEQIDYSEFVKSLDYDTVKDFLETENIIIIKNDVFEEFQSKFSYAMTNLDLVSSLIGYLLSEQNYFTLSGLYGTHFTITSPNVKETKRQMLENIIEHSKDFN